MPSDAYTLSFLANEFNNTIVGGKINKISQAERDEILFNIYAQNKTYKLIISANSNIPRMHFTDSVKENPLTSFNFLMNLRKHLTGAKIEKIYNIPYDRIIVFELLTKNDLKDEENLKLYIELMGKYSNIVLTDNEDKILSAIKTLSFDSRTRQILPGLKYELPLVKDNFCLNDAKNIKKSLQAFNDTENTLEKYLCSVLKGISPATAKEILLQSNILNNKLNEQDISNLSTTISNFDNYSKNNIFDPCIIYDDNGPKDVFPFVYKNALGTVEKFNTLNLAFAAYYNKKDNLKRLDEKSKPIKNVVKNNISRLIKKIELLNEKLYECEKKDEFNLSGELITANIYRIKPSDETLICENYYDNNNEILIKLDKNLSPAKNAQSYYKKYYKLKTGEVYAKAQLDESKKLLDYFLSIEYSLNNCIQLSELEEIKEELTIEGFIPKSKAKRKKVEPAYKFIEYNIEGFRIIAGKNNLQNDYITFKIAKPTDIWLHAKNTHGSHVLIIADKNTVPKNVIKFAAELAAFYSKGAQSLKCEVDYAFKKYVKKPSGSKPGFVSYNNYETVNINPNEHTNKMTKT